MKYEIPQEWKELAEGRECGPCYACCVWLGIEELKKYTGQTCKHLCGKSANARCGIYETRPRACSEYQCLWRAGWGPDKLRPDTSGILLTSYAEGGPDKVAITMNVIDISKAEKLWQKVVGELLTMDFIGEVRVIFIATKKAMLFRDGNVYQCELLPREGYESLAFRANATPIGSYRVEATNPPEGAKP